MVTTPTVSHGHAPTMGELFWAILDAQRLETSLLADRIERLTALLHEHGVPVPEDDPSLGASGAEHLLACRNVVAAAYDLLERLEELKAIVGSGMEFVRQERWR